ncbi:hypothetical protein HS041_00035 [Planomonospora sp. ID67723]|uniref:hypothetical protein n=1 Tax=Planomonospora sp. ID67723 TaxID=2738134 RepID=UPI0018C423AA|nr:hypothetical protein [Planomonospora sp. ID67723]MBG0826173.1 hypothetical protein [Planomonospora sp. ID67723]
MTGWLRCAVLASAVGAGALVPGDMPAANASGPGVLAASGLPGAEGLPAWLRVRMRVEPWPGPPEQGWPEQGEGHAESGEPVTGASPTPWPVPSPGLSGSEPPSPAELGGPVSVSHILGCLYALAQGGADAVPPVPPVTPVPPVPPVPPLPPKPPHKPGPPPGKPGRPPAKPAPPEKPEPPTLSSGAETWSFPSDLAGLLEACEHTAPPSPSAGEPSAAPKQERPAKKARKKGPRWRGEIRQDRVKKEKNGRGRSRPEESRGDALTGPRDGGSSGIGNGSGEGGPRAAGGPQILDRGAIEGLQGNPATVAPTLAPGAVPPFALAPAPVYVIPTAAAGQAPGSWNAPQIQLPPAAPTPLPTPVAAPVFPEPAQPSAAPLPRDTGAPVLETPEREVETVGQSSPVLTGMQGLPAAGIAIGGLLCLLWLQARIQRRRASRSVW